MPSDIIVSSTMLIMCLVLAGVLAISWLHFGRPSHALSWSLAYLAYGGETATVVLNAIFPNLEKAAEPVAFALLQIAAALVAIGARQRSNFRPRYSFFVGSTLIVFIGVEMMRHIDPQPWLSFADGIYTSAMLAIAMRAIRPKLRPADAAERLILICLAIFICFEMLLVTLDLLTQVASHNSAFNTAFQWSFAIGLMPVFMSNGVAAIMLISSDLARRLRTLAEYDPLTGALNRRGFDERAYALLSERKQTDKLAIAVGDVDWFKAINDNFGHSAGDAMLRTIHDRMNVSLGNRALVARIGGEEFAILMATSSAEQAATEMNRVREDIAAHCTLPDRSVTMSFGLTMITGLENGAQQSLAEAIHRADTALYRSKMEGRNKLSLAVTE